MYTFAREHLKGVQEFKHELDPPCVRGKELSTTGRKYLFFITRIAYNSYTNGLGSLCKMLDEHLPSTKASKTGRPCILPLS